MEITELVGLKGTLSDSDLASLMTYLKQTTDFELAVRSGGAEALRFDHRKIGKNRIPCRALR
jgi:hypothetical protein